MKAINNIEVAEFIKDANQVKEFPQVAAGENPLSGVTDARKIECVLRTARSHRNTPEWEVKTRRRHTPILTVYGWKSHSLYYKEGDNSVAP